MFDSVFDDAPELRPDFDLSLLMKYEDSAFNFDFDLTFFAPETTYNLDVGVDDLGLGDWLGVDPLKHVNVDAGADLAINASANIGLGFGFDLSDVLNPLLFVDPSSGFSAEVVGEATNLEFNVGLDSPLPSGADTLGLVAVDGSAKLELGFFANLGDQAADVNGNGVLDAVTGVDGFLGGTEVLDAFQAEVYGDASLDVPLVLPDRVFSVGRN